MISKFIRISGIFLMFFASCVSNNSEKKNNNEFIKDTLYADTIESKYKPSDDVSYKKEFHANGSIKMEGNVENGRRIGKWVSFYENGLIWSETHFDKGIKNGATTTWYPNGNMRYQGSFKDDKEFGHWIYYDENGHIVKEANFR